MLNFLVLNYVANQSKYFQSLAENCIRAYR